MAGERLRPAVLIVHVRSSERRRWAEAYDAAGFSVTTCPGPAGGAACPAEGGERCCPLVPAAVSHILVDGPNAEVVERAYRRWLPGAVLERMEGGWAADERQAAAHKGSAGTD